ncbi:hypothetical protein QVD17_00149 [Tagetes erecta]|uniref:Uncharacterized protein n=1 Tax=Tagetes erecta TaxID=13708 RepID=A0AAD8L539_TARER|nr:hypothetical protein QVD17_00149 [Tagetes erecta]
METASTFHISHCWSFFFERVRIQILNLQQHRCNHFHLCNTLKSSIIILSLLSTLFKTHPSSIFLLNFIQFASPQWILFIIFVDHSSSIHHRLLIWSDFIVWLRWFPWSTTDLVVEFQLSYPYILSYTRIRSLHPQFLAIISKNLASARRITRNKFARAIELQRPLATC